MVVGFNHNYRYDGAVYHIQTEDGGLNAPNIVTLLFHGGTVLASKKTSYADIAKVDNLEQVVEELMKEQHKNMLRSLKSGEFDEVLARFKAGQAGTPTEALEPAGTAATEPVEEPDAAPAASEAAPETAATPPPASAKPESRPKPIPAAAEPSLDEVILSYLMGDD